jgi:Uma2 family endonuclease
MSTLVMDSTANQPPRKRWSRAECEFIESNGLELVEGELISKMGKKRPHSNAQRSLFLWLQAAFGPAYVLEDEPIDVAPADNPVNEPVPDITVVNRRYSTFVAANPGPDEIRLLVEVAHSSLSFDRTTKASLYARAGIAEYWVLDVAARRLIVHRDPGSGSAFGTYTTVMAFADDEAVAPAAAPHVAFPVASAFG